MVASSFQMLDAETEKACLLTFSLPYMNQHFSQGLVASVASNFADDVRRATMTHQWWSTRACHHRRPQRSSAAPCDRSGHSPWRGRSRDRWRTVAGEPRWWDWAPQWTWGAHCWTVVGGRCPLLSPDGQKWTVVKTTPNMRRALLDCCGRPLSTAFTWWTEVDSGQDYT